MPKIAESSVSYRRQMLPPAARRIPGHLTADQTTLRHTGVRAQTGEVNTPSISGEEECLMQVSTTMTAGEKDDAKLATLCKQRRSRRAGCRILNQRIVTRLSAQQLVVYALKNGPISSQMVHFSGGEGVQQLCSGSSNFHHPHGQLKLSSSTEIARAVDCFVEYENTLVAFLRSCCFLHSTWSRRMV